MASQQDQQIFPTKKKPKKHHGHHGGAWKVAYADFVTAMMALFIVLWVLGQSEEVKQAVAGYFKDPAGFQLSSVAPPGGSKNDIINLQLEAKRLQREKQQKQFEEMKGKIMKELGQNPNFVTLLDQIEITMVDEGLKIEMLESADNVFFEIGSSKLNIYAEQILRKIGGDLKNLPNYVVVEGHTDSRRYNGSIRDYDNFDLSAERANSAKRALEIGGLPESHIDEIRGYADKRLRDPIDPYSLVNRRISIILRYL